jgi:hypothetical protein
VAFDEVSARARLAAMTGADREPTLDADDLDMLVELAKRVDSDGREPPEAAWSPTFDLNAAAHVGWLTKAGKATADFDFSAEGVGSFSAGDVFAMCERMAEHYRRKVNGTIPMTIADLPWRVVANEPA